MDSYILRSQRTQLTEAYLANQKALLEEFHAKREALEARIAEAEAAERTAFRDPLVLVRMSLGSKRKVYHSANGRCGRTKYDGGNSASFETMHESAAQALDHGFTKRCSACEW